MYPNPKERNRLLQGYGGWQQGHRREGRVGRSNGTLAWRKPATLTNNYLFKHVVLLTPSNIH